MSNEHPVTPPDELVQELWNDYHRLSIYNARTAWEDSVVKAYRAGADAELDANDAWIRTSLKGQLRPANWVADNLRAARRPKPPSLAEQGLEALEQIDGWAVANMNHLSIHEDLVTGVEAIRHALERLQELEGESNE